MTRDVRMRGFKERASVQDALNLIEERVEALGPERVPFRSALGRVLAEDVRADRNVPPHRRSAMDGYAVRSQDCPGDLVILGELKAAEQFEGNLPGGHAIRIMTGAWIPDGADAVVMVEKTTTDGEHVKIGGKVKPGDSIFEVGEDFAEGQVILQKGRRLRPQDVAMLVTMGAVEVAVQRRPRVRIIPTGTELITAGVRPTGSQIVESNSYLLEGLALRDGAEPILYPIVPDDRGMLARAVGEPNADVVVISGGSSVGQEDYAPLVVQELGELPLHGLKVKPGGPSGIGFIGRTVVVLAPGYPVASFAAWDLLARPVVQRMQGAAVRWPYPKVRARLAKPLKKKPGRLELSRVTLHDTSDGEALATPIPGGAALLSTATRADGFLYLEEAAGDLDAGDMVDAYRYV